MKKTILVVDDFDEIRELLVFMLESQLDVEILQENGGFRAIETLKTNTNINMVVSDTLMPEGSGEEIFKYLRAAGKDTPIIFLTGDDLESNPTLRGANIKTNRIGKLAKPFTDTQLIEIVKKFLYGDDSANSTPVDESSIAAKNQEESRGYIPIRLELLKKVANIVTPLYLKINHEKYIRVTTDHFEFNESFEQKYQAKNVQHLYVERHRADEFISEFKKKAMSDLAWELTKDDTTGETVKLNTELLRLLVDRFGWSSNLIEMAQSHFQRAFRIVATNPNLQEVLEHFKSNERFGYADHCSLLFIVAAKLSHEMGVASDSTLKRLTFASLFHDMALTDEVYDEKDKLLRVIEKREPVTSNAVKAVLAHPGKAAEICRLWTFCPALVDTIIFQHHERPNGMGFPMGLRNLELHPLSCIFIVCEDFIDYFIQTQGKPNMEFFRNSKKELYSEEPFEPLFDSLITVLNDNLKKAV